MSCAGLCDIITCSTCCHYRGDARDECSTNMCTNSVVYPEMGSLCGVCAVPQQMQEIAAEHFTLEVQNETPEFLTSEDVDDDARLAMILETCGQL